MNVVVCIKQVPGSTEVKINKETNTLIREGAKAIINPFDTYAIEEGVRVKEKLGGKTVVVTMGPPQAEVALREAIEVGADEAVLVSDRSFAGSDTLATSYVLGKAISKIGDYGLVIVGKQTMDGDTGQVGPEIAERLGIPFVAYVSAIEEIGEGKIKARRMIDEGHEIVESPLPCVVSVTKEINVPRLPSVRGKMKAKSARIPVWTIHDLGIEENKVGAAGSPTWVTKIFSPRREHQSEMLGGDAKANVDWILDKLAEAKLV
ncbi:MAG: electron transfer flavoprotein subunit beta/FixA family protein [Dehalococcoidia bacterium]|nr:electron transfer flavoprotein subunit beta/FixA family protein [Dehalococcoidia bacterium]